MINLLKQLIRTYQAIAPMVFLPACRFTPSCSNYAIEAIERHGCVSGSFMAFNRICRCQPFSKGGYDPVKD